MKIAQQRQSTILTFLQTEGEQTVLALSERLGVSALTIRRDLESLAGQGVQRFHGGARFVPADARDHQAQCKLAIAKVAAKRIAQDDILLINSSSTALQTLSQVRHKRLTAITNNAKALSASIDAHIQLVLTGGDISFPKEALTGEFAVNNLKQVSATRCLMGISGISLNMGLSTSNLSEVAVNHTMLARTVGEKIIVADSTKVNQNSAFISGDLREITTLITDQGADALFIEQLRDLGVEVVLVKV